MKSLLELILLIALVWIASWCGGQHALMPLIWWIIAVALAALIVPDVVKSFKKSK